MDLPEKYRPRRFEDLVGQEVAVNRIVDQLRRGSGMKVTLHGPSGAGKSTVARIVANAVFCEQRLPSGSPCLACDHCKAFARGQMAARFKFLNAADHGRVVPISSLIEAARRERTYVAVIDEAHHLETKAAELLLTETDSPPAGLSIILTTNKLELLERKSRALLDRFDAVHLSALSDDHLTEIFRTVALKEGLDVSDAELEVEIVQAADGSARALLRLIGNLAELGGVSRQNFIEIMAGRTDRTAGGKVLAACVLEPTFGAVVSLIEKGVPAAIREQVEQRLGSAFRKWATMSSMSAEEASVAKAIADVAQAESTNERLEWEHLIDLWRAPGGGTTPAQVVRMASVTHRRLQLGTSKGLVAPPVVTTPRRVRAVNRSLNGHRYLSEADIHKMWLGASSYTQLHGESIRLLFDIVHRNDEISAAFAYTVVHGISTNYAYHRDHKAPLGWLYVHSRTPSGLAQTRFAVALPSTFVARAEAWISNIVERQGEARGQLKWLAQSLEPGMRSQVMALRKIAEWLDPTVSRKDGSGRLAPLIDILGVHAGNRRALGAPIGRYTWRRSTSLVPPRDLARPVRDAFALGEWDRLGDQWELGEHLMRARTPS